MSLCSGADLRASTFAFEEYWSHFQDAIGAPTVVFEESLPDSIYDAVPSCFNQDVSHARSNPLFRFTDTELARPSIGWLLPVVSQ